MNDLQWPDFWKVLHCGTPHSTYLQRNDHCSASTAHPQHSIQHPKYSQKSARQCKFQVLQHSEYSQKSARQSFFTAAPALRTKILCYAIQHSMLRNTRFQVFPKVSSTVIFLSQILLLREPLVHTCSVIVFPKVCSTAILLLTKLLLHIRSLIVFQIVVSTNFTFERTTSAYSQCNNIPKSSSTVIILLTKPLLHMRSTIIAALRTPRIASIPNSQLYKRLRPTFTYAQELLLQTA